MRARRAGALAGLCLKLTDTGAALGCEEAVRSGHAGTAVVSCREEYERTGDPQTGAQLANSLRRAGNLEKARELAEALVGTRAAADALFVLGRIAISDHRLEEAERDLRDAAEKHAADGRWGEVGKDLLALGGLATDDARLVDALRFLDRCIAAAKEGRDPVTEGSCRIGAARVLWTIGYSAGAQRELDRVDPQLTGDAVQAPLELERGNIFQERGEDGQAVLHFRRALAAAERAALTPFVLSAHLNLAYSLAELGRLDEAARHVREAEIVDRKGRRFADRRELEARIALRRGALPRAAELAEEAHARTPADAHDERHELEALRAEIAQRQGDLAAAEVWARRAVESVEAMRGKQGPLQVRTWVAAQRWRPYELLFSSLAGRGDAAGALVAFERWQGRALLDRVSSSRSGGVVHGLPDAGPGPAEPPELAQLRQLEGLISSLQGSPFARPAPEAAILAAARAVPLLALVVADGTLWRISGDGGALEVAPVAPIAELRRDLDRLRTRPGDAALAARLGDLLVPAALARESARPLHVILDEHEPSIAQLPAAALAPGGRLLVAARPVVRAVRPSDTGCVPAAAPRHVAVIADAADNLPGARREAAEIAGRLSGRGGAGGGAGGGAAVIVALGPSATRGALLHAAGSDLLHVAVHSTEDDLGGGLELRDGRLSALEVAGLPRAPARVVLAACHSGVAETGTASMAAAFLAAGSSQVVATLRTIDDAAAARLTHELYRADLTDLPRTLARLQASGREEEWLKFAVFGRATCSAAPDRSSPDRSSP